MDKLAAASVVRRQGWLSETGSGFQDQVLARADLLHFRAGQRVSEAGSQSSSLYGVASGRVLLSLPIPENRPALGHIGGPGFWLGDVAAATARPRLVTATAGSRSWLFRLSRAELLRIVELDPGAWRHVSALLARNFTMVLTILAALKTDEPDARIAALLLNLVNGQPEGPGVIQCSQSDLGAIAALGRTTVSTVLTALEELGAVRRRYASIEITDPAALARVAAGERARSNDWNGAAGLAEDRFVGARRLRRAG